MDKLSCSTWLSNDSVRKVGESVGDDPLRENALTLNDNQFNVDVKAFNDNEIICLPVYILERFNLLILLLYFTISKIPPKDNFGDQGVLKYGKNGTYFGKILNF